MRLDIERQKKLEPIRMAEAKSQLAKLGYEAIEVDSTEINFNFKGNTIKYFPYSGWAQGKGIKAGRGLQNLLRQL